VALPPYCAVLENYASTPKPEARRPIVEPHHSRLPIVDPRCCHTTPEPSPPPTPHYPCLARTREGIEGRRCLTRTKRYVPVPSIPRAGSIPHLRGIFLKWGDPILIQTPPIFGSTHPILETKHRLKGRQRFDYMLSPWLGFFILRVGL